MGRSHRHLQERKTLWSKIIQIVQMKYQRKQAKQAETTNTSGLPKATKFSVGCLRRHPGSFRILWYIFLGKITSFVRYDWPIVALCYSGPQLITCSTTVTLLDRDKNGQLGRRLSWFSSQDKWWRYKIPWFPWRQVHVSCTCWSRVSFVQSVNVALN